HQQAHIERVSVGLAVHIRCDLTLLNLIALSAKLGLEFRSVHGNLHSCGLVPVMLADPKREEKSRADHRNISWMPASDSRQLSPSDVKAIGSISLSAAVEA